MILLSLTTYDLLTRSTKTCSELRQQIPINVRDPLSFFDDTDEKESAIRFYESTPDEVRMLNSKFSNKGSPFDEIPISIIKKMSHILAPVISKLFNMSIMEGIFSSCSKIGRVIPIFKSGKKVQTTNYRPINTLPIVAVFY